MSATPATVRKKLPIGIQTLSEIILDGYYYVDKTRFAHQLVSQGKYYFLSRPRRFGKSLFLDTLKEMFEGNQALFRGLYLHDQWDWSQRFAVLRISFGGGAVQNADDLARMLHQQLEQHERRFALPARYADNRSRFTDLIMRVAEQSGQRVVVLVDEYDKPILDQIASPAIASAIREELKNIYSVIKDLDAYIRFAMLTGVSKFSKVSLFSGLNNLEDISLDPAWSALCGYTEADLQTVFAAEMPGLDSAQIKLWYNGYNWLGEAVYNPFDLLLLFKKRKFKAWWFETGTPGFLVKLMAERGFFTPHLARLYSGDELLSSLDIEHIGTEALLFQTGYLTIHGEEEPVPGMVRYQLGYPNREVETSLNASLLAAYIGDVNQGYQHRSQLQDVLRRHETAALQPLFHAFFASIPHQWYANNPICQYEGYYASVFYSYFAALGFTLRLEDATSLGRIDMTLLLPDYIYLFEFKVVKSQASGKALQQLKDKAYADKYRALGLPIALLGVEFASDVKNVVGFEVEILT